MKFGKLLLIPVLLLPSLALATGTESIETRVDWRQWSPSVFERAKEQERFVLLNLEAVWCHWCHVMDRETYSNEKVADYLHEHYIPVRVDQDARPDLANRYRDWGWPATIVFSPDGTEIVKRAGYIAPDNMLRLLKAIVADPSPEGAAASAGVTEAAAETAALSVEQRTELRRRHRALYDDKHGGLDLNQKFLDEDHVEYAMWMARLGNESEGRIARHSLDGALNLVDPVWGGVYQYSTHGDWDHAHFEKIMSSQADYLRIYSLAYAQFGNERYRQAAEAIHEYLVEFLSGPEGAFYASQDADVVPGEKASAYFELDDADRRKIGMPRIDRHRYARENGWAITALAHYYAATGERTALERARRAAAWVIEHRAIRGGGFRHGAEDAAGPYLGDTLAMGRAFLRLHEVTGERDWLARAEAAAGFIDRRFRHQPAGYVTAAGDADGPAAPVPTIQENTRLARFANLLARYTADETQGAIADHALRFLASPAVVNRRVEDSGILLADRERRETPRHLTVVGPKDSERAGRLFRVAVGRPGAYKRVEWWDRSEGPLPNPDVRYPERDRPAAYYCTAGRCSRPAYTAAAYRELINRFVAADREESAG